ncbi:mortality factor 4-like protein 1 [Adelges cooleyi]|uniref:mortality factor 4-like protein 1 n=1 Tax=Adelges cooleyi TaxID=133065 RepID=UPI0021801B9D|nr:mortality factor 4-like protein 1 [Adelges cooleyi]
MDEDVYRFAENEVVLCYYQSILYEGKVVKRKITDDNEVYYYIHYYGWNNSWDEWVHDDKVLSVNEFSVDHMASLHFEHNIKVNLHVGRPKKRRPLDQSDNTSSDEETYTYETVWPSHRRNAAFHMGYIRPGTRRYNRPPPDRDLMRPSRYNRKLFDMPTVLKRRVAFDYSMINVFHKQLKCPPRITISQLVIDYIDSKQHKSLFIRERAKNVSLTMVQHFNAYRHKLLYEIERLNGVAQKAQYLLLEKKRQNDLKLQFPYPEDLWCSIYGPIYLLRFCVNLEKIIKPTLLEPELLPLMIDVVNDFYMFIVQNFSRYFSNDDYEVCGLLVPIVL